jgi:hypothetical protein
MKSVIAIGILAALCTAAEAAPLLPKELVGEWCPEDTADCDPRIEG